MIIREKNYKYTTEDLIEKVNESLLNDKSKDLLINFIDSTAVYYTDIYHQLSRQALAIDIFKQYKDINKDFAQFIFDCLSSETIDNSSVNRLVDRQLGLLHQLLDKVLVVVITPIYNNISNDIDKISNICNNFKESCNGLILNNRDIYGVTNIDNYTKPKHYKMSISEDEPEDKETKNVDDFQSVDLLGKSKDPNVKLVSLKSLGLKVKPNRR